MSEDSPTHSRNRRIEDFGIVWENGQAKGWVFSVGEAFKPALDIYRLRYVDRKMTDLLRKQKGRTRDESGQLYVVYRTAETRGRPPARAFKEGDTFYEPAEAARMQWSDALQMLNRLVQITAAREDDEGRSNGWVVATITHYTGGQKVAVEQDLRFTQEQFELGLRTGFFKR